MASPQKENGFTPIANELVEALARTRINGEAMQVLMVILRKTYGFNKKQDVIALSQFMEMTGLKKQATYKGVKKLLTLGIVTQKDTKNSKEYCFVKNYALWKPLPKKVTVTQKGTAVTQKGDKSNPKRVIQKTKYTLTKDIDPAQSADIAELIKLFELINPLVEKLYGSPPQRKAAGRLLRLHPLDYWRRFFPAYQVALEDRFCPKATTPLQMENKFADIAIYGRSKKADKSKREVII